MPETRLHYYSAAKSTADFLRSSDMPPQSVSDEVERVYEAIRTVRKTHEASHLATGATIWLVPTFKSVEDWKPVAVRHLPDVDWVWRT